MPGFYTYPTTALISVFLLTYYSTLRFSSFDKLGLALYGKANWLFLKWFPFPKVHKLTAWMWFHREIVTPRSWGAGVAPGESIIYMHTGNTCFHPFTPQHKYRNIHSPGWVNDHHSLRKYMPQLTVTYTLHTYYWYKDCRPVLHDISVSTLSGMVDSHLAVVFCYHIFYCLQHEALGRWLD